MLLQDEGMTVPVPPQRITLYDRPKSRHYEISKRRQYAHGYALGCADSRLDRFPDYLGTAICLRDRLTLDSLTAIWFDDNTLNFLGQCCGACPFVLFHFDRFNS